MCLPPGPWAGCTAETAQLGVGECVSAHPRMHSAGAMYLQGSFRLFSGVNTSVSCHVPVLSGLSSDYGWGRLECDDKVLSESPLGLSWRAHLQGLWDCGGERLEPFLSRFGGPQLEPKSVCLLPEAWVGLAPP